MAQIISPKILIGSPWQESKVNPNQQYRSLLFCKQLMCESFSNMVWDYDICVVDSVPKFYLVRCYLRKARYFAVG